MRKSWVLPLLAVGMGMVADKGAQAAGQGPYVIPGVGPEQYSPQPQPAPQPRRANYGGGFLELLVTGRDPSAQRPQAAPAPEYRQEYRQEPMRAQRPAPVPMPAYSQAPPIQRAAYAPEMEPMSPVRRAIASEFQRQEVDYHGPHGAGTIVVDTPSRHLYLVQGNGRALRYGIGVGRPGFEWAGAKTITRKAEWPGWTPPPEMLLRRPELPKHMEGGPNNPLGARAMYLGSSLYRIHGTNEPHTIGQNVSSGCIRMMNDDVTDLYERVKVGTKVVVM